MNSKFVGAAVTLLLSVSVLGASEFGTAPVSGTIPQSDPCPPILTGTSPTEPKPAAPAAPANLRILGGGGGEDAPFDEEEAYASGPHAWPDEESAGAAVATADAYFAKLTNRADCLTSFSYASQANIDVIRSRSESDAKIPIVYDAAQNAAKFEIDPSGSLPHSGSTGTPQKFIPIQIQGTTSMFLVWDLKIAKSMLWKPTTETRVINGETSTVTYLDQHKSHRLDDRSAGPWVGIKQNYVKAGKNGTGVAELFFSAPPSIMGPGTTRGSSEVINPVAGQFFIQPDTWTRVWILVEGNIGTGDNAVRFSAWVADENRAPMRLYNRVNLISPPDGIGLFRFEFDSSLKIALNGPGQQYQRNFVVLKGITEAEVLSLLEKPVQ